LAAEFEVERFACPGFSNGNLLATPQGGLGPYLLSWLHDGTSGISLMGISSGNYGLNITDASGCSQTVYGEMQETAPQVRMPTGFNPLDGLFQGVSNCDVSFQMKVFNKWGELIYVGSDGWDGKINGNEVPTGTYTYLTEYSYTLDSQIQSRQIRGVFTLIR
jgi:gliding motility-associated-like protein